MSLFFSNKASYLGVDIGTASIKIVELKEEGGLPRLVTYGYIDIESDIIRSNTPQTRQKVINSLKKVIESSQVTTDKTIAALPTFSVFNSIITLPQMSRKDLASAIKWEAKKYIPLPLEEMILDWKIIEREQGSLAANQPASEPGPKKKFFLPSFKKKKFDEPEQEPWDEEQPTIGQEAEQNIKILVTAAPKNLINRYLTIFKAVDLKLLSLETEAFALARSLIGHDQSTIMIADVGSITTDICIIENRIPILNRSIDVGGLTITKAIADSLNINLDRAEQFKRDFGVKANNEANQKGILKTITASLSPIINETRYVLDLYQGQENRRVEKIVLAGGSAFLPNLAPYFTELFNKPTIIGNPWDRVIYPKELEPILNEIGPRLTVAIGLAMREI
ncbi:pilus assembly protein PilM [Patescibacteria group bacterium]|nr:pilus assembly protein PilM [Patescibacteria group bacterium]